MRRTVIALAVSLLAVTSTSHAQNLFSLQFGPCWPSALVHDKSAGSTTAWDASVGYGLLVDQRVGLGLGVDFLWNSYVNAVPDSAGIYTVNKSRESFMFPLFGFVLFDPAPKLTVHPSAAIQVGYNSLVYVYDGDTAVAAAQKHGYYYGVFTRLVFDGNYDLIPKAALQAGFSYQWAGTRRNVGASQFVLRDMGAFGIHIGMRLTL